MSRRLAFSAQERFLRSIFPGIDSALPGISNLALSTTLSIWGAYVAVIGAAVLVGSRQPLKNIGLAWLMIATEVLGALGDAWLSTLDHVNKAIVTPAILLHSITAVLGIILWWRTRAVSRSLSQT